VLPVGEDRDFSERAGVGRNIAGTLAQAPGDRDVPLDKRR
jgi:hypothetical protein